MFDSTYSVVIATLGGPTLSVTVSCLLESDWPPHEILVCIPETDQHRVENLRNVPKVRIIATDVRGQVAQRAVGFSKAVSDLVLQCDDDVVFEASVTAMLRDELLSLGLKNVVGPVFCRDDTGTPVYRYATGVGELAANIYFYLIAKLPWGKARMGRFSTTTCATSLDPRFFTPLRVVSVDWLAGGFVLGWRQDLVLKDFYPFSGKAYCEDLMHARERSKLHVKHHVVTGAHVIIDVDTGVKTLNEICMEIIGRYRVARRLGAFPLVPVLYLIIEWARMALRIRDRVC